MQNLKINPSIGSGLTLSEVERVKMQNDIYSQNCAESKIQAFIP